MIKSTNQLTTLFASNPSGCLAAHLFPQATEPSVNLFRVGATEGKSLVNPSFLVPAIIDALRKSDRYKDAVRLVPGEADNYCAKDVISNGGLVITSDSDLLAQDLGTGEVAFFRDIHRDDNQRVVSAVFAMANIMQRLGLTGSADAPRFAYQRKLSPQSSLQVLVKDCRSEVADAKAYAAFLKQYQDDDVISERIAYLKVPIAAEAFDPRLSEVFFQMLLHGTPSGTEEIQMFLPVLSESHERGTAWEPTTSIRQLAYSLLKDATSSQASSVKEYRRVQNPVQKGRHVPLLKQTEIENKAKELVNIIRRLKELTRGKELLFLPLLSIVHDVMECNVEGKNSHVLKVLQNSKRPPQATNGRVSWELTHFVAHIHAGLHSFRIIKQVLDTLQASKKTQGPWQDIYKCVAESSLDAMPDFNLAANLTSDAYKKPLATILAEFTDLEPDQISKLVPENRKRKVHAEKRKEEPRPHKKQSKPAASLKNNPFGSLAMDE